jgi:hypothetical protein
MKPKPDILDEIRPTLRYRCNIELLDYLKSFRNREAVTIEGQQYLLCIRKARRQEDRDEMMFLPLKRKRTANPRFPVPPELLEFYLAFDGLRDYPPPTCGNFVPCAEVITFEKEWSRNDIEGFMDDLKDPKERADFVRYVSCPQIFWATNGDQIVQMPDGKYAWWELGESRLHPVADSFPKFLEHYLAHLAVGDGWGFDSHGRD